MQAKNQPARIICRREFIDGTMRPIYEDGKGQYVVNDDGDHVRGVYLIPRDEPDLPIIVEGPVS